MEGHKKFDALGKTVRTLTHYTRFTPPFSQTQRFQSLQSWRVQTYVHLCALYGISIDL